MNQHVVVAEQFRGPPDSGNGGYVSGLLAGYLSPSAAAEGVEVTLRAPTPLDSPMLMQVDDTQASAHVGETLIGQALPKKLALDVPRPPSFAQALAVQQNSPALDPEIENIVSGGVGFHPICFCCGADVAADQGLRVFAAPVPGFSGVAAAWQPDTAFQDDKGFLPAEIIWAALDCPGQYAYLAEGIRTGLLGRMTAKVLKSVSAGDQIVITGWCIEMEGKKHFAGTALFNQKGECCAYSKQVWIGHLD
jgi:hypothetical protein